jgi:hypothetical protein
MAGEPLVSAYLVARAGRGEGPESTRLSRSRRMLRTAGVGHEEQFPPPRLSAGFGFRKETIAGMHRNGRGAPITAVRGARRATRKRPDRRTGACFGS